MANELELYIKKQPELVAKYNGKVLGLHNGEVQGVFESKLDALDAMRKKYAPGDFMVIKCTKGDEEYTRRFRSRVLCSPVISMG